jgi:hypothetical protein
MPLSSGRPVSLNLKEGGQSCFETVAGLLLFLAIGAGLSFWGWTIVRDARASAAWPHVEGVVTGSEVTSSTDGDGAESYSPQVTYTYLAGGRYQESYVIKFGENSYDSRRRAEAVAARYPVGRKVTVYYDRDRPGKSVLEPGVTAGSYIALGIGALFVVISLLVLPLTHLLRRRDSTAS